MKYLIADVFFVAVFCCGFERVYNFVAQGIENLLKLPKYLRYTVEDLLLFRLCYPVAYTVRSIFGTLTGR